MDGELKNMKLNINQLAALSGLHRQTVTARMADVPLAPGSNEKKNLCPDGPDYCAAGKNTIPPKMRRSIHTIARHGISPSASVLNFSMKLFSLSLSVMSDGRFLSW